MLNVQTKAIARLWCLSSSPS